MRWIALMFLTLLPANLAARNEPEGFRGVPWGASERTLRASIPIEGCRDSKQMFMPEYVCESDLVRIRGAYPKAQFWFQVGGLVKITLAFLGADAASVEAELTDLYGSPAAILDPAPESTLQSASTRILIWVGLKNRVRFEADAGRPGWYHAIIQTVAEREDQLRYAEEIKAIARAEALARSPMGRCSAACHEPRGFDEDVVFLRAAASYSVAQTDYYEGKRRSEQKLERDLAHGRAQQEVYLESRHEIGRLASVMAREGSRYSHAVSVYIETIRQHRGIGPMRMTYLLRVHNIWLY